MRLLLALPAALVLAVAPEPASVSELKERYVSAVERAEKSAALAAIAATAPASARDATALFDLFIRFPDPAARRAALDSLARSPIHASLEPLALAALGAGEPESVFFGAHLAERARTPRALEALRKAASRRLPRSAADSTLASERQAWWARHEALDRLAAWEGAKALPLLRKRAEESPAAAAIIGRRLWADAFPELLSWARSSREERRAAALEAARQPIEPADARATRATMLAALADPALGLDFRHQLALKVGASSDAAEAEELGRRHDAAPEPERPLWAAALFISRQPAAVPRLARYAALAPDESHRARAREQLESMVGAERAAALVQAKKDDKK